MKKPFIPNGPLAPVPRGRRACARTTSCGSGRSSRRFSAGSSSTRDSWARPYSGMISSSSSSSRARAPASVEPMTGTIPGRIRRARLDEQRAALRAARHVQRTAHLEELSRVVHRVDQAGVGVDSRRLVADLRVVLPAVPQPDGDVHELGRPPVALAVRRPVVEAEVERGAAFGGGDDVPARPAAADVVQRREPAGPDPAFLMRTGYPARAVGGEWLCRACPAGPYAEVVPSG